MVHVAEPRNISYTTFPVSSLCGVMDSITFRHPCGAICMDYFPPGKLTLALGSSLNWSHIPGWLPPWINSTLSLLKVKVIRYDPKSIQTLHHTVIIWHGPRFQGKQPLSYRYDIPRAKRLPLGNWGHRSDPFQLKAKFFTTHKLIMVIQR